MKTVLHIFSGDLWAGAEVMTCNLLKELRKNSNLRIIALGLNEGVLTTKLRDAGVETYVISEVEHSFFAVFLKALRIFKGINISIIHSHRYKENLMALLLAKAKGVKCLISTVHGLSEKSTTESKRNQAIGMGAKLNYFILNNCFNNSIAVSNEIKTMLVNKYGLEEQKVRVIHNGIPIPSLDQSTPRSDELPVHIGSVGRLVPVKGYELFLALAAQLKGRIRDVHFSILGDGPLLESLTQKVKELKLDDVVKFVEPVSDPISYYKSLDIYVNTSLHEGIPLSVLEAMALGLPVIATKVGGIPEVIIDKETGFLLDERSPTRLADICMELINENWLSVTIGNNARDRVSTHFNVETMARRYVGCYEQCGS